MTVHPLESLSAFEVATAVKIFREQHADEKAFFSSIALKEPNKGDVLGDKKIPRVIELTGVDQQADGGFVSLVDVTEKKFLTTTRLTLDAQVAYNVADFGVAVILTKSNAEWLERVAARGIDVSTEEALTLIQIDPWPAGGYAHESIPKGHRALRCISFVKEDATDNGYARPIHGLIAHVDVTARTVTHIEDSGVIPMPTASGRYDATSPSATRSDLKPLSITQPEGTSFKVEGNKISWQGFDVRASVHPVNGLVLHELSLQDRPILYRAALSEMVVPYGDSDPMHSWKHVLDASEYNMGTMINSLKLGCDCLGEIHYLDSHQVTFDGNARTIENAICIHEEDYGIQWKHHNASANTTEVRRSRRLVISSVFTIGNYDYGFYWYLYLDGTIQMEVKLTGIVGVSAITDETFNPAQSPIIGENLSSPVHQHLFCFRLDWHLDGGSNSLFENQIEIIPISPNNPEGTQFQSVSRPLTTEIEAIRDNAPHISRNWKVVNPASKNKWGVPVAYKLLPAASPTMFAQAGSQIAQRAAFASHNLWATPFAEDELSAAGPSTVMHAGQGGLAEMTAGNRNIDDCDLVMWHTVALTHVPRPEDWPVMPVEYTGFHLIPVGFFNENPTLDLPRNCEG
jgi:primary-amine oxidase